MITCRLVTITHNPEGQHRESLLVSGETLPIGRAAGCPIHLQDPEVDLLHATVSRAPDGTLQIEAPPGRLIHIDGFMESGARLHPCMCIRIGRYLLTVGDSEGDLDLVLSLEASNAVPAAAEAALPRLAAPGASKVRKRSVGLGLAAFILLLFLVLPTLPWWSAVPGGWQADLVAPFTHFASPGPLMRGHRTFQDECTTCHERPFHAVADSACTQCHERVGGHLAAGSFDGHGVDGLRCIDCHPAHPAKAETARGGASVCLSCHRSTKLGNARVVDFDRDHPPFRLSVPAGEGNLRVIHDGRDIPAEQSGLKFSHQIHLAAEGVSTPEGDTVLTCPDCHLLERSGDHFEPIEMEKSCQQAGCHRVRYPKPIYAVVPHGPVDEVMKTLRLHYAEWLARSPARRFTALCAPAEETENAARTTLDCIHRLAEEKAGATLFRTTGKRLLECALCHEVTATGDPNSPWAITPVRTRHDWQPKARFPHSKHRTTACVECHDKSASRTSDDVAFPRIDKCRECHAGSEESGKVRSRCEECHTFHRVVAGPG